MGKYSFWEDKWLRILPLKKKYLIFEDKRKCIQQVGEFSQSICNWNLEWRRSTFKLEGEQL